MKTYPYTAWTFGNKNCEAHEVVLVTGGVQWAADSHGVTYKTDNLFETKRQALIGASRYLDRKQAEIDKQQAGVTERREFLAKQRRATPRDQATARQA